MTLTAIQSADASRSGIAAAVLNTINQVGSLIGVASFGTIVARSTHLTSGIHVTLWISAILFFIVGTLAFMVIKQTE